MDGLLMAMSGAEMERKQEHRVQSTGADYQNTLDIVSGCSETPIAASEALAYESEEGYSDWYLPSKDELVEMYYTIGSGGPDGNIGEFNDSGWY